MHIIRILQSIVTVALNKQVFEFILVLNHIPYLSLYI